MRFADKTALITGGASGIGRLSAERLAAEGAKVVVADVDLDAAEAAAETVRSHGGDAKAVHVDVRNYEAVEAAVAQAVDAYGSLDILVNSAGGDPGRILQCGEPFHKRDIGVVDWGLDVNFRGVLYCCHAALTPMIEQQRGVIIMISSITGLTGAHSITYSACKSGLIGLTKSLAIYGAPHGVRACCVTPGPVLTRPGMARMKTLLGHAAQPGEIVDMILYLCSESAVSITGSNHVIDGGRQCLSGL